MQGLQKIKCTTCGNMFMSDGNTMFCSSCAKQSYLTHKDEAKP